MSYLDHEISWYFTEMMEEWGVVFGVFLWILMSFFCLHNDGGDGDGEMWYIYI